MNPGLRANKLLSCAIMGPWTLHGQQAMQEDRRKLVSVQMLGPSKNRKAVFDDAAGIMFHTCHF